MRISKHTRRQETVFTIVTKIGGIRIKTDTGLLSTEIWAAAKLYRAIAKITKA